MWPEGPRVCLQDYKMQLGQLGIEMGDTFEVSHKGHPEWKPLTSWSGPVRADGGDIIAYKREGANARSWERDVLLMKLS